MYARVARITTPNASPNAGVAFFQNVVLPDLRELDGFCEALLLASDDDNTALVISLWDTLENLQAGQRTPAPHRAIASGEQLGSDQVRDVDIFRVALRA